MGEKEGVELGPGAAREASGGGRAIDCKGGSWGTTMPPPPGHRGLLHTQTHIFSHTRSLRSE